MLSPIYIPDIDSVPAPSSQLLKLSATTLRDLGTNAHQPGMAFECLDGVVFKQPTSPCAWLEAGEAAYARAHELQASTEKGQGDWYVPAQARRVRVNDAVGRLRKAIKLCPQSATSKHSDKFGGDWVGWALLLEKAYSILSDIYEKEYGLTDDAKVALDNAALYRARLGEPLNFGSMYSNAEFKKLPIAGKWTIVALGLHRDPNFGLLPPEYQVKVRSLIEKKYVGKEQ
jgi:hypothetical protein